MAENLPEETEGSIPRGSFGVEPEAVAPEEAGLRQGGPLLDQTSTSVAQNRRSWYAEAAPEVIPDNVEKIVDYGKILDAPEVAYKESPLYFVHHNNDTINGLEVALSPEPPKPVRKI